MVRIATVNDIQAIRAIAEKTWPSTYEKIISADQIDFMLHWMYNEDAICSAILADHQDFLVATNGAEIVGFAGIEHHYLEQSITRIHKLYVLPSEQGNGTGKKLLTAIKVQAKLNDSKQLHLNVNKENKAVAFYHHNGFSIVDSVILEIGQGFIMDDFIMTAPITN
jgi:N-acetylglutamate synthase-like GNAT family acetyltransferase